MIKKIPMRRCIGCGESKEKKMLIRVIRSPEGRIMTDPTGRAAGRGAYLCRDPECLRKAVRRKSLNKALRDNVPAEIYAELEKELRAE